MKYTLLAFGLSATSVFADASVIEGVEVRAAGGAYTFSVTLSHGDTGWDDYADGWRVVLADGTIIGTRTLYHPHVEEQPFTRSLSGVSIPDGVTEVFIEASTNTDGWDGQRYPVSIQ